MNASRAVFFDRDGVVNASPGEGYVLRWEDFHLLPGLREALLWLKRHGWRRLVVTNQQCVGKGKISLEDLSRLHARMQESLGEAAFDEILVCPHRAEENCACRKPQPGMVLEAARRLGLDLAQCWLVGDHDRDIQMARAAGIGTAVRFLSEKPPRQEADFTVSSHAELAALFQERMASGSEGK
jgi:histidinol-phosphate phosphatase family protein